MIYLALPVSRRRLSFYLAAEEWAARVLPPDDYFFAWRVEPTVICGRNQEIDKEIDLDYCRREGIDIMRRKSGGGAVYADLDNYMFSYICPDAGGIQKTFARYTTMVADMLRSLGIDAAANGRNDIVAGGRKISGNAFYHLPGRAIAHGTMLYQFDAERLGKALTPSRAKLESKAVVSVNSRVTSLMEQGLNMGHEEFENYAVNFLCTDELTVDADGVEQIAEIEKTYLTPEHLYGRRLSHPDPGGDAIVRSRYLDGVGEMTLRLVLDNNGSIVATSLSGDFLLTGDPEQCFMKRVKGLPYRRDALAGALDGTDPSRAVAGLSARQLTDLLID